VKTVRRRRGRGKKIAWPCRFRRQERNAGGKLQKPGKGVGGTGGGTALLLFCRRIYETRKREKQAT